MTDTDDKQLVAVLRSRSLRKAKLPNKDKMLITALWEKIGELIVERNVLRQLLLEDAENSIRKKKLEKLREETGREHSQGGV